MNNRCGLNGASPHICTCKQNSGAMQGVWSLACGTYRYELAMRQLRTVRS